MEPPLQNFAHNRLPYTAFLRAIPVTVCLRRQGAAGQQSRRPFAAVAALLSRCSRAHRGVLAALAVL